MPLDKVTLDRALDVTRLLIEKQSVNPWLVEINLGTTDSLLQPIELHIGLAVLVFELQQCEVQVDDQTILGFVQNDIKTHKTKALNAYFQIARNMIDPGPTRKSSSWFSRVFTSPPKWTPPMPLWKWTSVTQVVINDDALVIRGTCCEIAKP